MACPTPECADFGLEGGPNLRLLSPYGPGQWRLVRCATCGRRFSERQWSPFFRMQLSIDKIVHVLDEYADGRSVRLISQLVGVDKNSVLGVLRRALARPHSVQAVLKDEHGWSVDRADQLGRLLKERARLQDPRYRVLRHRLRAQAREAERAEGRTARARSWQPPPALPMLGASRVPEDLVERPLLVERWADLRYLVEEVPSTTKRPPNYFLDEGPSPFL